MFPRPPPEGLGRVFVERLHSIWQVRGQVRDRRQGVRDHDAWLGGSIRSSVVPHCIRATGLMILFGGPVD